MALTTIDWFANPSGQSVTASLGGAELSAQRLNVNLASAAVASVRFCLSLGLALTLRIDQSLDSGSNWATFQTVSLAADSGGRTYWSNWHTLTESEQASDCLLRAMLVGMGSGTFYYLDLAYS